MDFEHRTKFWLFMTIGYKSVQRTSKKFAFTFFYSTYSAISFFKVIGLVAIRTMTYLFIVVNYHVLIKI